MCCVILRVDRVCKWRGAEQRVSDHVPCGGRASTLFPVGGVHVDADGGILHVPGLCEGLEARLRRIRHG